MKEKDIKKIKLALCKSKFISKNYVKLDKEVTDIDNNVLIQYYKIKNNNIALVLVIDESGEVISIDTKDYTSLKKLKKQHNIK